jgi:hypothetical protein
MRTVKFVESAVFLNRPPQAQSRTGTYVFCSLLSLLLLLFSASVSFAQVGSAATLRGVVKDPQGAAVPDASVTLTSKGKGAQRTATTDDRGSYVFTAIDPDEYSLRVEKSGFATQEVTDLRVSPSETRSLDVELAVGSATATVTVVSANEEIKTETGEKSQTITAEQINNLSLVGRSSLELLRVLPGVVAPDSTQLESTGFNAGANRNQDYSVNGLRGVNNNISIDGSRVIDIGSNNGSIITANNDMVQEVEVKTSNYAAEYGSSGVQISAVTKGGGKDFHGELYDYLRPHQLAANDRSNSIAGSAKPLSKFQYPGGNVGGPVLLPFTKFNRNRDKLFFFYALEFQRQAVDPGTLRGVVPTLKQRQGDFSEFLPGGPLFNKFNQGGQFLLPGGYAAAFDASGNRRNAPNNNFAGFANPLGSTLLNLYPAPNYTDPNGQYNYASTVIQPLNRIDMKARFDYKVSDNTSLYLRLARESESQDFAYGLWWTTSNYELPSHVVGTNLGRSASLNLTSVISPTMTNEVVFSASKLLLDNDYADPGKVSKGSLNYTLPYGNNSKYLPITIINEAWTQAQSSPSNQPGMFYTAPGLPLFAHNDSYSVTDNLSKIAGSHTIKFGGLIERADKIQNISLQTEGQIQLARWGSGSTNNQFADLFTGQVAQFTNSTASPVGNFRFYNFEFYGQDSWKVRPNFTLEYGMRVEFLPNNQEINSRGVLFSPERYNPTQGAFINGDPTKPNGLLLASRGEIPKGLVPNNGPQFAPRLNFAWDISRKGDLVLRGGAGLFYNRVQGNYQYYSVGLPPNAYSSTIDAYSLGGTNCGSNTATNCAPLLASVGSVNPYTAAGFAFSSQNPQDNHIPRTGTMSLSVAKRLPFQNVLEVSYVGTLGRHLPDQRNANPRLPTFAGIVGNADISNVLQRAAVFSQNATLLDRFRPFPTIGDVKYYEYAGTSAYHSMQLTLSRQLGKDLQYFLTYTFSKALGTTAVDETGTNIDPFDARGRSFGILPFDRTHIFNLSYNYYVPKLARGSLDNWAGRGILNGWQISGITTVTSGAPLRVTVGGDLGGAGTLGAFFGTNTFGGVFGSIAPTYLRDPSTGNTGFGSRVLDPSAFGIPAFGQSGAFQSPFYMRAPRRTNFDVSFFKNFKFSETRYLQFRSGFFNLFNAAFANPGDIDLVLQTTCNRLVPVGTPNGTGTVGSGDRVCDPTGGFTVNPNQTFGQIVTKHGHRIVEVALKFYF